MILGLIREYKNPPDRRVTLSPQQCQLIKASFPDIKIKVQSSPNRIFKDDDYRKCDIEVSENMSDCTILLGIKEVTPEYLLENKTYMFFSHTIKKQEYNREMLKQIIKKNIKLIDYECLHNKRGRRILGFGKYAGIVGTYEILRAMGRKYKIFEWQSPSSFKNYSELKEAISKYIELIKNQKNKIVLTGSGRVISGCTEVLQFMKITSVSPGNFLNSEFEETVYTILDIENMYERKDGKPFSHNHFFDNHNLYKSKFKPYTIVSDIMINGVYWDQNMARHFEKEDTKSPDFRIKLIADISCDIEGSVPLTIRETTIENPVFGWDGITQKECKPYTDNSIDIMSISNLPTELPADASEGFGEDFIKYVLPELLDKNSTIINEATICQTGKLNDKYSYLHDFAC